MSPRLGSNILSIVLVLALYWSYDITTPLLYPHKGSSVHLLPCCPSHKDWKHQDGVPPCLGPRVWPVSVEYVYKDWNWQFFFLVHSDQDFPNLGYLFIFITFRPKWKN
jgi:hypothetical protein